MSENAGAQTLSYVAHALWAAGMKPVALRTGTKRPLHPNWETYDYDEDTLDEFLSDVGLGLRWGQGYVDVDLENQVTATIGAVLLPPTTMSWGRPSLSGSHRVYRMESTGEKTIKVKNFDRELYAEIRHHHSQSAVPPSRHPETGGWYAWNTNDGRLGPQASASVPGTVEYALSNIPTVEFEELEVGVRETVFAAAMADLWPRLSGSRHDAMLGICGMLLKSGRPVERVQQICELITRHGEDPDPNDRLQVAYATNLRLMEGEDVAGYTLVEASLGPEVAKWAAKMFHVAVEQVSVVGGIPLNDVGNSQVFCNLFGDDLMYLPFKKDWCAWNGSYWELVNTSLLEQTRAKQTVKHLETIAPTLPSAGERSAMRQHALSSGDAKAIAAMVRLSRDTLSGREEDLDKDAWLFNVPNGTIDLRTGELGHHRREDRITRIGGVEYDPKAECPQWQGFLLTVFDGDEAMVEFTQRMAGYALTGNTREQCMFFLYGHGKNGKTTFIEVLTALFGSYAVRTPSETLIKKKAEGGIPNDIARLRGARFVASKEVEANTKLAESVIKDLTGGDTITARFMHGEWFDFKPVMKLLMYGNHKPIVQGQDDGIWRRIRLIPFTVKIADAIDDYASKLLESEGSGILRWCVEGCLKWQVSGLLIPEMVAEATQEYKSEMDTLGEFLATYYVQSRNEKVPMESFYGTYMGWCASVNERALSQRQLNNKMVERGCEKLKTNGKWYLRGITAIARASDVGVVEYSAVGAGV